MIEKLNDYNGEYCPDLKLSDFSSDTLLKLLSAYSKMYIALDGFWFLTVKDRASNEEALACDIAAWEKICKYEMTGITRLLNIQGHNVAALIKALQVSPWYQHMKYKFDINSPNFAVLTVTYCPTLNALEKEGQKRENEICNIVEPKMLQYYASFFSADIKVKCLKSPPRQAEDEICCQWEFSCGE